MLHAIRGVRFPLKINGTNDLLFQIETAFSSSHPKLTKILNQLKKTFGICAANP